MSQEDTKMNLYRETSCEECGRPYSAFHTRGTKFHYWRQERCFGSGGSREKITIDYEAAQERMDAMLSYFNPDVRVGEIHVESDPIVNDALVSTEDK